MASRAWRASRQVQQSVWRSVRDPGSIVPRRFTSTPGDARSSLLPSFGLRTRAFSTEEKLPDAASQVVMLSDEEDEDDDLEEENLPPWRQLKPWRWQPPEEDLGWLKIFQLPKVQVDEAGRSYIIGFYATGICIFFTFVLAAACDASTCHAFSDRAVGEIPTANEPPNAPVAGGEKGTQGRTEEAQVAMGQNLRAPLILLAQAGTMRGVFSSKMPIHWPKISVSRTETAATGQAFLVMAEAEAAAPDGASGASSPVEAPGKRSTLYKEDVLLDGHSSGRLVNEHTAVWGSLFDPESKRWGYKCCTSPEQFGRCTAEKAPEPEANSSDLDNSPDSEDLLGPNGLESWQPLLQKGAKRSPSCILQSQISADENYKGFPDLAVTTLKPLLQPSREALDAGTAEILIRRLHNPRELATRSAFLEHAAAGGVFWVALLVAMCLLAWASAAASWPASTCDGEGDDSSCGFGLVQTRAGRAEHGREAARSRQRRPLPAWQQRAYLVGASHKAGTEMLHHIMKWTFDVLGGTDSCDYDANGGPITAYSPMRAECHLHPARLRFSNHITGECVKELRALSAPVGGEIYTALGINMPVMPPEEGIPEMGNRMINVIIDMANAYKAAQSDMMIIRFETITKNSANFNQTIKELDMVHFLFQDEITHEQRQAILDATVAEDINRADKAGLSWQYQDGGEPDHSNDDADMVENAKYLHLMNPDLYKDFVYYRHLLGYEKGEVLLGRAGGADRSESGRPSLGVIRSGVLEQLDEIATNSSNLDYLAARAGYMKLTLGNKTWNNTFVAHVAACTMKGAREYRRNRDNYNTYDMDPDSQKYMHALLKLVQLAQCLRPNGDQSKNCDTWHNGGQRMVGFK
ncbi:unnamed protein product [Durusdinium trenchii]|uniref:Uncharacterized protein n=1 Tax=Durusdinium trenchii TaxID=1381693 RepID=A0ABP0SF06_9DINO